MRRMRAATLISSPWMRTAFAPSSRKRPSVPCAWKPVSRTVALLPQPVLEMMADAAGIAHAARGDDDVEARELFDRLAFLDGLGEAQMRRRRAAAMSISGPRFDACWRNTSVARMAKRRIEKDRRGRNLAALHQIDEIDDQLLGALDRKGRDEQGAVGRLRLANFGREVFAPRLRRDRRPVACRRRSIRK